MTRFEYGAIFYGIVIALAIENVASSFHKLLEAGRRVRWHWMAPTNAVSSSVIALGQFWLWWKLRDAVPAKPTLLMFLPSVVAAFLLYLVCAATLPDAVPEEGIDLKKFYLSNRRQLWSLVAVLVLLRFGLGIWSIAGADPQFVRFNAPFMVANLVTAAFAVSMIYVRALWWHALGIIVLASGALFLLGPMTL